MDIGPGYVRILLEVGRDKDGRLAQAAELLLSGRSTVDILTPLANVLNRNGLIIDTEFGAIPVGDGVDTVSVSPAQFDPASSGRFVLRAYLRATRDEVPRTINEGVVYSDPSINVHLTGATSPPVGETSDVQAKLDVATLEQYGLDGSGVAIAVVDTGIFLPRLTKRLGRAPNFDRSRSWSPSGVVTPPGKHRLGHGTMCAYDALIAAPNATLLDIAMLIARPSGDHSAAATVSAAVQAYWPLIDHWVLGPAVRKQQPKFHSLVINNSWGILHPSLDLSPGHPGRFIDNPNHIFRLLVRVLVAMGVDIIFAASNCGPECPTAVCLGRTSEMIMGANSYDEVLTLAGCEIHDQRVGYSSVGPSIANMPPNKPDLTAYTHFLGSKVASGCSPDSGTSAASAVAAGCVAALRTRASAQTIPPPALFHALKDTARKVAGSKWDPGYGHGIIRPVDAARYLGLIP